MAKQEGIIRLKGTIGGITFYNYGDQACARKKSSLDKERFYTDPAFEGSRRAAGQTGKMAPVASVVYRQLPEKVKKRGVFGKMTAEACRLLRAGLPEQEIINNLYLKFNPD